MDEWSKTASERDIQRLMLTVAMETRDKIETIRAIAMIVFVLALIGVVASVLAAAGSTSDAIGVASQAV